MPQSPRDPSATGRRSVWVLLARHPQPSETFLERERAGLAAHGWSVQVVALTPGDADADSNAVYRPAWRSTEPWRALAYAIIRQPRGLVRVLRVCGRELLQGRLEALRWLRNLPTAAWLTERVARHPGAQIHASWANLPAQIAWMARQLGGPAYTVAGHAYDVFVPGQASPEAWREAAGLVVCNRAAWRAAVRRCPACAPHLVFLPHGLPLADWRVRSAPPMRAEPVVLGVGRLNPKKGFDVLVAASADLARRGVRHRVVLLGDGPERAALTSQVQSCQAPVTLLGRVPLDEVRRWMTQAAVVALPSRRTDEGDRDGLANVLLEAMAVGVPVITTTAGSAGDAVRDGVTGRLVPPDDPRALANGLVQLLADPDLAERLAQAARRWVERRYDLNVNTRQLARWLDAMAGRESAR